MGAHDMGDHTVFTKGDDISNDAILQQMIKMAKEMRREDKSTAEIAEALQISENHVRNLLYPYAPVEINWRHNCLTRGIHDGRQEAVWNLPLYYAATTVFGREDLKCLVLARIYNDAMQFVVNDDERHEDWANRVFEEAKKRYDRVLQHKVGELSNYYKSASFKQDMADAVERVMADKLNPHFEPLHGHDSINTFCRILGVSASIKASN